jgi:hypothetical protein
MKLRGALDALAAVTIAAIATAIAVGVTVASAVALFGWPS